MSELKTKVTDASVEDFINSVPDEKKQQDSRELLKLFAKITGEKPKMWGSSIIGYGQYHYKSERSKQEGDWYLTGFSPKKANFTLYILAGFANNQDLLKKLGKHKVSTGGCLYLNKLADVDMAVLEKIIEQSYNEMKEKHP